MTKVKMVKCLLRAPGEAPALRFVPLREYQLWKYYMTHAHEKIVEGQEISIWVDAHSYGEQPPIQARPLEAVVRVEVQYWDRALNTAAQVHRYFPADEYGDFRDTFLHHYPDVPAQDGRTVMRKRVAEVRGYYIQPRLPDIPEVSEG
jgi:hypothetical protein